MKVYSFKKGLGKAIVTILTITGAWVAVAGLSDFQVWDLAEQYLKPFVGTLTVGGLLTLTINWAKIRFFS